jgi:Holliday junction resolvase RusA-like endonuclease
VSLTLTPYGRGLTLKMARSTFDDNELDLGLEYVRLEFPGPIPSKKNKLRPRMGGRGQMYDPATKGAIAALATLAAIQWGSRLPVQHPSIGFELEYVDALQDRDGIWTTLLDALKKGGVIVDDSIKFFNGTVIKYPAVKSGRLCVIVTVGFPRGSADKRVPLASSEGLPTDAAPSQGGHVR